MIRALAVVAVLAGPAVAETPSDALARVEATYAKTAQLTASFTQTVRLKTFGQTKTSSGKLYAARPDKMRWDYDKVKSSFIFDGKTLWVVEPQKLQVTKKAVASSSLPVALTFLTGAGTLSKEFAVAAAPRERLVPGATVLELTPKQPSASFATLYLVIEPAAGRVDRTIVVNSNGDETTYALANVNPKPTLDVARTFTFSPSSVPTFKVVEAP